MQFQLARDLGYTDHGYVILDELGWSFVPPGSTTGAEDELYDWSSDSWVQVKASWSGRIISAHEPPVRRRNTPSRWSCGHAREYPQPQCTICWVIYGWPVTT